MSLRTILLLAAPPVLFAQSEDKAKELDRVAQVATAMVDGDVCLRIQTPRSAQFLLKRGTRGVGMDADGPEALRLFNRLP